MLVIQVIFTVFVIVFFIQLGYYFGIFSFFIFDSKKPLDVSEEIPVSIIIAAKNEASNLTENLAFLAIQEYKNFEIILVNDHSKDATLSVMQRFKETHPKLIIKIIDLKNNSKGNKKNALSKAIAQASHPNLLFTDADCKPKSKYWITLMAAHFQSKEIVLGYGAYQKIKNSWLNKIIRFETLITAIQYFSYAKIGIPYMGVGRNLAYKKKLFIDNNGFETHKNILSGDDDLFINSVATKENTAICYDKKAHTISKVNTDFKKWLQQKKRHITTAGSYQFKHQLLLGLYYVSNVLFWVLSFVLLVVSPNVILVFLFLLKLVIQYFYFYKASKKLDEKDLIIFTPILELFLIGIQMYLFISNILIKPKTW